MTDARITELWEQSQNDAEGMRLGYTTQQHYFAALVCEECAQVAASLYAQARADEIESAIRARSNT